MPNEHAYNMFLSVMQMFHRLKLWETVLAEKRLHVAWERIITPMNYASLRRWLNEQNNVKAEDHAHARYFNPPVGKIPTT
jgi:uncharacterized membrane protein YagU involved in acid resistance